jgi:uncharacterized protein (DUF58 family)
MLADALGPLRLRRLNRPRLMAGSHAERKAGPGSAFWQYRPLSAGEGTSAVDWRKSARSDAVVVREREREIPGQLALWWDGSASMRFQSEAAGVSKAAAAWTLMGALGLSAQAAEEAVQVLGHRAASNASALASALADPPTQPLVDRLAPGTRLVLASDFLGLDSALDTLVGLAQAQGWTLHLLHICDPLEVKFPFTGRVRFAGMESEPETVVDAADAARTSYLAALEAHGLRLEQRAALTGGTARRAVTDQPLSTLASALAADLTGRTA